MDPYIIGWNVLAGLGIMSLFYSRKYVALAHEVIDAATVHTSDEAFAVSSNTSDRVKASLERLIFRELVEHQERGERVMAKKIVLNQIRLKSGRRLDPDIFTRTLHRRPKVQCAVLYNNSVVARHYQNGFPLEACVQSLTDGLESCEKVVFGIYGFDRSLYRVKALDDSHNALQDGVLVKNPGYHSHLGRALLDIGKEMSGFRKNNIVYVVTTPLSIKERRRTRQAIEELKSSGIQVGIILLKDGQAPAKNYVVCEDPTELPKYVSQLNRRFRVAA